MHRFPVLLFVAAMLATVPVSSAIAGESHAHAGEAMVVNATCPASGKPVDRSVTTTVGSYAVAFCCADCVDGFEAKSDVEKATYVAKHLRKLPLNATCPVSGKAIDATVTTMVDGKAIGFCCPKCKEGFAGKDAAEQSAFLADTIAAMAPVNASCPISGKPLDPAVTTYRHGVKLGACCAKCIGKLEAMSEAEVEALLVESILASEASTSTEHDGTETDS